MRRSETYSQNLNACKGLRTSQSGSLLREVPAAFPACLVRPVARAVPRLRRELVETEPVRRGGEREDVRQGAAVLRGGPQEPA